MNWGPGKSLDHILFQTKYYLHASKSATSVKKYDTDIWVSIPVPMKGWLQGLFLSFGSTRVNWLVTKHLSAQGRSDPRGEFFLFMMSQQNLNPSY
jgi:hypothetical protein